MHPLAIFASLLLICACVVASVLLAVYQATKTAPVPPPATPPVPPSDANATPRAPAPTVATTTANTQGVVIASWVLPPTHPEAYYHEGPEVVISRSVIVNGVEVELPPEEDPPNYGLND